MRTAWLILAGVVFFALTFVLCAYAFTAAGGGLPGVLASGCTVAACSAGYWFLVAGGDRS